MIYIKHGTKNTNILYLDKKINAGRNEIKNNNNEQHFE